MQHVADLIHGAFFGAQGMFHKPDSSANFISSAQFDRRHTHTHTHKHCSPLMLSLTTGKTHRDESLPVYPAQASSPALNCFYEVSVCVSLSVCEDLL